MSNRWKMNRIGFVNFWLYDSEVFELEDGKILLRGQNGSGKSITTQSFIPFILDGDRSPSRLDPFGTSDRRMEYYFLGDGEKEESTGYLYLEFKKEESNEYCSIGIGQTAHKGRPMSFWGFVLNDGRRIDVDLSLSRKVAGKIIPLDKTELKKILGDNIPFTDSSMIYKQMVNQYLFGFERIEQYDQFIKLLIKVRAPKLSNSFKPSKVYEILNESLQVLSDDDLRPMVDAMEKMDSIQENLEGLKRSISDASMIMKEYDHYNKYMLAKKANNYLNGLKRAKEDSKELENTLNKINELKNSLQDFTDKLNKLHSQEEVYRKQIEQLADPNLENLDTKLSNLNIDLKENTTNKENKEKQIEQKRQLIIQIDYSLKELNDRVEYVQRQFDNHLKDMDDLQVEIQSDFHLSLKETINNNNEVNSDLIKGQINVLKNRITEGLNLLNETNDLKNKYEENLLRQENNEKEYNDKQFEYDSLVKEKEKQQDILLNDVDSLKDNKFWHVSQKTILDAKDIVQEYDDVNDSYKLRDILKVDFDEKQNKQKEQLVTLNAELKSLQEDINNKQKEYEEVSKQKIIEPSHDEYSLEARKILDDAGIKAYPFYQTIEFNDSLSIDEQAIIEQQLYKAGLLDALVVSYKDYERINQEFKQLNDVILFESENISGTYDDLTVDKTIAEDVQVVVNNILSHFSKDKGSFVLNKDGYFKHGMIEGHAFKKESEYIGINARKRKKQQMLDDIKAQLDELWKQRTEKKNDINGINDLLVAMKDEYNSAFDVDEINKIIDDIKQLSFHINELIRRKELFEKETNKAYENFKNVEREMLKICSLLPYARSKEEYNNIISYLDDYKDYFNGLLSNKKEKEYLLEQISMKQINKEDCLIEIDNYSLDRDSYINKINSLNEQLEQLRMIMNNPEIIERTRKLQDAKNNLETNRQETGDVKENIAVIKSKLESIDSVLQEKKDKKKESEEYLNSVKEYFKEELNLGFVIQENDDPLLDNARRAISMQESNYMTKQTSEMVSNLYNVYQKYNSNLTNYNATIDKCFYTDKQEKDERVRSIVTCIWIGKKLNLPNFIDELRRTIETQEELIKKKDRELFEDILSQTISQKLSDRIDESAKWVKQMSNLMKNMDTSMGLSFSLEWKARRSEDENEMDINELEKLLTKDKVLVSEEEMSKVSKHFRSIIQREKQRQEMNNEIPNYLELVRNALDYRKWYEFKMSYIRVNESKKDLTNSAFNRFSGGEKAMAMYVPLFAAVNAQYQKTTKEDHPRIIALDEAFAGVDEKNIASMFKMVEELDFDYIMNSQALWGCYETVKRLKISELLRPLNANYVTVIDYIWNGKEKIMR